VESLERKSDVELRQLLRHLAGTGNRELLLEVVASSRIQEVFTRRWYDDAFMVFGVTGDVHGAQLWQQSSPCFVGVEGAESEGGKRFGTSVLQLASGHGRVDMVQWLLEQKADVDASREEPHPQPGRNALHDAANFRCWETCALLLQHRANVNAKDCHGETALHYAMKSPLPVLGRPEMQAIVNVCQALLSGRADPAIKSNDGSSALDIFSLFPIDPDITRTVEKLLRRRKLEQEEP